MIKIIAIEYNKEKISKLKRKIKEKEGELEGKKENEDLKKEIKALTTDLVIVSKKSEEDAIEDMYEFMGLYNQSIVNTNVLHLVSG